MPKINSENNSYNFQFELNSPMPKLSNCVDSSQKDKSNDKYVEQFFDSNQESLRVTKEERESTQFNYSNQDDSI